MGGREGRETKGRRVIDWEGERKRRRGEGGRVQGREGRGDIAWREKRNRIREKKR